MTPDNPAPPIVVEVRESTRFFLEHGDDELLGFARLKKGERIALREFRWKSHQGQMHVAASFERHERTYWVIVQELKLPVA